MHGPDDGAMSGAQVLLHAPLWRLLGDIRYALYSVTTPAAPGAFLPAGRPDRWVYGVAGTRGDEPTDLDPPRVAELIRRGAGVADLDVRIEQIKRFRSPGQLAERFRVGRAFLVGDAAHRVTPRGGTGMNTALHSGYDLGWKLAWVLRGWGGDDLLDSYEAERRVVAEHNLARSTDPNGSRRPVLDELTVDIGGRLTHAWLPAAAERTSTLDLLGPGWTVFTTPSQEAGMAAAAASAASAAPVVVRTLDAMTARALGLQAGGALLARPDGVPTATWGSAVHPTDVRIALRNRVEKVA
jgi:2-polyprenyl-6-methoxyphenol hydroxylase-like FAD-dependent oxidoreductase